MRRPPGMHISIIMSHDEGKRETGRETENLQSSREIRHKLLQTVAWGLHGSVNIWWNYTIRENINHSGGIIIIIIILLLCIAFYMDPRFELDLIISNSHHFSTVKLA